MPNGGSDCCGTCWFNAKNKGGTGYDHASDSGPDFCIIRELEIRDSFYTYCCNHPHRRPDRDPIPIGPVFAGGDYSESRKIWRLSPDTEEIREHLLELLAAMKEKPQPEYPMGHYADEIVVWQLGEFREVRAADKLEAVAGFSRASTADGGFKRTRESLVAIALVALEKIKEGPA